MQTVVQLLLFAAGAYVKDHSSHVRGTHINRPFIVLSINQHFTNCVNHLVSPTSALNNAQIQPIHAAKIQAPKILQNGPKPLSLFRCSATP